jgi:hypothetical protein
MRIRGLLTPSVRTVLLKLQGRRPPVTLKYVRMGLQHRCVTLALHTQQYHLALDGHHPVGAIPPSGGGVLGRDLHHGREDV